MCTRCFVLLLVAFLSTHAVDAQQIPGAFPLPNVPNLSGGGGLDLPGLPPLIEIVRPKPKPFPFVPFRPAPPQIIGQPNGAGAGAGLQPGQPAAAPANPNQPSVPANPGSNPPQTGGGLQPSPVLVDLLNDGFSKALARAVGKPIAEFLQNHVSEEFLPLFMQFAQQVLESVRQQLGESNGAVKPPPPQPPAHPQPPNVVHPQPPIPPHVPPQTPNDAVPPPQPIPLPVPNVPVDSPQQPPQQPAAPQPQVPTGYQTKEILKVLKELDATDIFPDDFGFMRKVAWQESRDGSLLAKSKEFVRNGGIWQIDPVGLEDVQKNLQDDKKQALRKLFDVDVEKIDRSKGDLLDIRKAAAAARAFVYRIPSKIPPTDAAQATYWKEHYNTPKGKGTAAEFLEGLKTMPSQ